MGLTGKYTGEEKIMACPTEKVRYNRERCLQLRDYTPVYPRLFPRRNLILPERSRTHMLDEAFANVYTKFKLHFYKQVFGRFAQREATLTTVETFCMEVILALGQPTIAEFSNMLQISAPNAAYKISSLVQKGYVEKVQSQSDRREYHLVVTQKYKDYYNVSYTYLQTVIDRVKGRFPAEDVAKLEEMLTVVSDELMEEIDLPARPEGATDILPRVI